MKTELTIQDILDKANQQTKRFINDLEAEENLESVETVDSVRNDIRAVRQNVELKKKKFIDELKGDLGANVKENPNKVIVIKKTFGQKVKEFFKNIFTRF